MDEVRLLLSAQGRSRRSEWWVLGITMTVLSTLLMWLSVGANRRLGTRVYRPQRGQTPSGEDHPGLLDVIVLLAVVGAFDPSCPRP